MNHVFIVRQGAQFVVFVERPDETPMVMYKTGESAYCAPYDVVNDRWTNGQYGWLIGGFWNTPPGTFVWIEQTSSTALLDVYHERQYADGSYGVYVPIFGTADTQGIPAGTKIYWDFSMLHNQYATDVPGLFRATYDVYLGDASGQPVAGYTSAQIELSWIAGAPDVDGDGDVDLADAGAWHEANTDVNEDGVTDFFDAVDLVRAIDLADGSQGAYVMP